MAVVPSFISSQEHVGEGSCIGLRGTNSHHAVDHESEDLIFAILLGRVRWLDEVTEGEKGSMIDIYHSLNLGNSMLIDKIIPISFNKKKKK